MGQLIVLTTPELELGYRLAGVMTHAVDSARETEHTLHDLLEAGAEGDVIAVHEPFFQKLDGPLRQRIDAILSPLVIALPAGREADVDAERRAQLLRMLWQAVGYQMTFDSDTDPS